jgi:hypothetical protein
LDLIPIRDRYENIHPNKKRREKGYPIPVPSQVCMKKPKEKPIG